MKNLSKLDLEIGQGCFTCKNTGNQPVESRKKVYYAQYNYVHINASSQKNKIKNYHQTNMLPYFYKILIYHFTENKLVKEGFKIIEWNRVLENRS